MALPNSEVGRAILNDAVKRGVLGVSTDRYFHSYLHDDPWPLFVRYEDGKTVFVPRDQYYFRDPTGPSACLWIIPGSAQS